MKNKTLLIILVVIVLVIIAWKMGWFGIGSNSPSNTNTSSTNRTGYLSCADCFKRFLYGGLKSAAEIASTAPGEYHYNAHLFEVAVSDFNNCVSQQSR